MRIAFLMLSVPWAALAQAPDLDRVETGIQGLQAIQAWRVDEARRLAAKALEERPEDPVTWALIGQVKMHLYDYAGAADAFERADRGGAPPELSMESTLAEAARMATQGYEEHVAEHFILRFTPGRDQVLVPYAVETLEAARERIGDLLGWKPEGRVGVEIYPAPATLSKVSTLTQEEIENSGTIALCRWNRLMVTSPRGVVFGYAWRDTMAHELAHLIIGGASKNTVPIWLHEGLAKYVETAWRGEPGLGISIDQQQKLAAAAKAGKLIPFEKMHPSMAKLPTQEDASLAFSEVFTFIEYLIAQKGWDAIRRVLAAMAEGKSDEEAIRAAFGESLGELEKKWKRTLPSRPIRDSQGVVMADRKILLKERAETPDDNLHGLPKKARRHARSADLLFRRGRLKGAQIELERAYAEFPSPLISGKLAMVALAAGDLDASERAARAAIRGQEDFAGPSITLAEVLLHRNKLAEAKVELERAIDVNPLHPKIHPLLAMIVGKIGTDAEKQRVEELGKRLASKGEPRATLGKGGRIHIEGPMFARVYLRQEGQGPFIATGAVTPTHALEVEPGRFELMLVPPAGPPTTHVIEVNTAPEDGSSQAITTGRTGS
jgi:tetratricopeptide (TPR) repeat protein